MNRILAVLSAAVGSAAALLLAGCSVGGWQERPSIVPGAASLVGRTHNTMIPAHLFISNAISPAGNTVEVYENGTYKHVGVITKGVSNAEGLWVDKAGNLYISNASASNVTEYAPGGKTPICTYSKKLVSPINETTDSAGNLYVLDFNHGNSPGYIDKYHQCNNVIAARYSIVTPPEGVAVDAQGNIFVSYLTVAGGAFEEFKKGEKTPTQLRARGNKFPGDLAIDGKGNLISDDQSGAIDVIPPPYTELKKLVSGLGNPFGLALNENQTLLFGIDTLPGTVSVYKYPSGKLVTTLGASDGVTSPGGVADSPNSVF